MSQNVRLELREGRWQGRGAPHAHTRARTCTHTPGAPTCVHMHTHHPPARVHTCTRTRGTHMCARAHAPLAHACAHVHTHPGHPHVCTCTRTTRPRVCAHVCLPLPVAPSRSSSGASSSAGCCFRFARGIRGALKRPRALCAPPHASQALQADSCLLWADSGHLWTPYKLCREPLEVKMSQNVVGGVH